MGTDTSPQLPTRVAMEVETRLVNPLVERLLRSRLHWLLSRRFAVLSYEGRVSGNRITTPVLYERDGGDLVVTTAQNEVTWWKNFRGGHPATLWVRGAPVETMGRAVIEPEAVEAWVEDLRNRSGLWRVIVRGLSAAASGQGERESGADLVIVRFTPRETPPS